MAARAQSKAPPLPESVQRQVVRPWMGHTQCAHPLRPHARCTCGAHQHKGAHLRWRRATDAHCANTGPQTGPAASAKALDSPKHTRAATAGPHLLLSHYARLLHARRRKTRRRSQLYMHLSRQRAPGLEAPGACARTPYSTHVCSRRGARCLHVTARAPGMQMCMLHLAPVLSVARPCFLPPTDWAA